MRQRLAVGNKKGESMRAGILIVADHPSNDLGNNPSSFDPNLHAESGGSFDRFRIKCPDKKKKKGQLE